MSLIAKDKATALISTLERVTNKIHVPITLLVVFVVLLLGLASLTTWREKLHVEQAKPIDFISKFDSRLRQVAAIGTYVSPRGLRGGAAYSAQSDAVEAQLQSSAEELQNLLGLLPIRYARMSPASWDPGWGDSSIDRTLLGTIADSFRFMFEEGSINSNRAQLERLVKATPDELTLIETHFLKDNPQYAFIDRSSLRQAFVDVAWEMFTRSAVWRSESECLSIQLCATNRLNKFLQVPPLEELLLDAYGKQDSVSEPAQLLSFDLCGDYVKTRETITNGIVDGMTQPSVLRSLNPRDIRTETEEMRTECDLLNSKFNAFSNVVVAVRKLSKSFWSSEGRKAEIRAELLSSLSSIEEPLRTSVADNLMAAHEIYFSDLGGAAADVPFKHILFRTLLASQRPDFHFDGRYFSVRERMSAVHYLGRGQFYKSVLPCVHERPTWTRTKPFAIFARRPLPADSFSQMLDRIDADSLVELNSRMDMALDAYSAADILLREDGDFSRREGRRGEIYDQIRDAMTRIGQTREAVASDYSDGYHYPPESARITHNWAMPGQTLVTGQIIVSATPVFRLLFHGERPRFDQFPKPGSVYIARVHHSTSITFPPEVEKAIREMTSETRNDLVAALRKTITETRKYTVTISDVTAKLLSYEYSGRIDDLDPPYVDLRGIGLESKEHFDEAVRLLRTTGYLASVGESELLYLGAGTLLPENSYTIERIQSQ